MVNLKRFEQETNFEYMLRLVLAKRNKDTNLGWDEIAELLGGEYGSAEYLRKLAYGIYEYDDYLNGNENKHVANRILCISDLHIPFHLPLETFAKYKGKVDTLILNGDIVDMQGISKFPKSYRVSPMEELIEGRAFIISLLDYLKPKRVVAINGNHELRFGAYLAKHLDSDVLELMPNSPLELIFMDGFKWYDKRQKQKIDYKALDVVYPEIEFIYPDDWKYQIGDTIFTHPYTFSGQPLKTADKALDWFLKSGYQFDNLVVAHTHKVGNYFLAGKGMYEQGCLFDLEKNNYTDGKLTTPQSCGYIYMEQNAKGSTVNIKQEWLRV